MTHSANALTLPTTHTVDNTHPVYAMHRCGQDRHEDAMAYRDFITSMLREQLRSGDVLALTAASGIALGKTQRAWYD